MFSHALSHRFHHAYRTAKHAHSSLSKHRERGEKMVGQLTQTATVGVSALGFGFLNGYGLGTYTLAGTQIPVDLAAGLALQAAAFFNMAGKYDEMLHNFGDGALASYFTKLGAGMGARKKAGQPIFAGNMSRGNMPGTHYPAMGSDDAPLTQQEFINMAHAMR